MKISEIQRGEHFSFSGFRWLAIEPTGSGTYALLDSVPELLKRRPFANLSTRRGKDLSDWKNSLARYVLRHTFLPELLSQNDQHAELLEMTVDLTALDGTGSSTFEDTIGTLLEYADSMGKHVAEYEVFDGNQMNPFRVAVFAVVPVLSLVFRPWLAPEEDREKCILLNMSIVSLMFMLLAMMNGANMFGRLARYFVLGSVCTLPWILDRVFNARSARLIKLLAAVSFLGFFLYDNQGFSQAYHAISLTGFIFGR